MTQFAVKALQGRTAVKAIIVKQNFTHWPGEIHAERATSLELTYRTLKTKIPAAAAGANSSLNTQMALKMALNAHTWYDSCSFFRLISPARHLKNRPTHHAAPQVTRTSTTDQTPPHTVVQATTKQKQHASFITKKSRSAPGHIDGKTKRMTLTPRTGAHTHRGYTHGDKISPVCGCRSIARTPNDRRY